MGFLDRFLSRAATPAPLPAGSFTVNQSGEIITCTVPSTYSREKLAELSSLVLRAFRDARDADLALTELTASFGAMQVRARELRGGAIIFLSPRDNLRK